MHVIEQYLCGVQEWNLFKQTHMNLKYCQIQVQMTQQIEIFLIEQIDNWWLLHEESNLTDFIRSIFAVFMDNYNISRYVELLLISPNKPVIELNNLREVHNQ